MSVTSHVSALQKKHEILSETIEAEQRRLASDNLHITEMKREKLRLKEEIGRLSS